MTKKIKLQYCCFLNNSGYSQAAQDYILSLYGSNKYDIKLHIFGKMSSSIGDKRKSIFSDMINKDNKNRINVCHCIPPMQRRISKNDKNIGFGIFETFSPPENWISILEQNEAIITPSFFNQKIFAHTRIKKPIFYIPHCFDVNIYNDNVIPLEKYNKFTFLFFGSWRKRKGYPQLIEAYLNEFDEKDDVQLIIKTDKYNNAINYIEKIKNQFNKSKGFSPILFEKSILDEVQLPRFLKSVNCLVSPNLGEGFGLPGLQCMSLRIPIIITDFSGCQDYAKEETSLLLRKDGFILHSNMDKIPQFRNKKWAFISVKKIRESMRYAINNYNELKLKANNGYEFVHNNFNYNNIEEKFTEMIGMI